MLLGLNLEEYCINNHLEYLLTEWNYDKNNKIPSDFTPKSNQKVWWKCNKNHEWEAKIASRTMGNGCPVCAGKIIIPGINDLKTFAPDVCREWNYEKNNGLNPEQFAPKSSKRVWWKCHVCEHEWSAIISNRANGSGCPNCSNIINGNRIIRDRILKNGSLKDSGFQYLKEWDYEKNDIDPSNVAISSNKKFWWTCNNGHSWQASPNSRNKGHGCGVCNSSVANQKKILFHLNRDGSFADNYPEFIKYWDFELNDVSCYELTSRSGYMAHWKCPDCGHNWETKVSSMSKGLGCPNCVASQDISNIQKKTQEYLLSNYKYELQHEKKCSILPKNPKTNYPMPYDNELVISDNKRLIIEVNGIQHYYITGLTKKDAETRKITAQESLEYQKWRDEYKKQYALDNGYYYLELPYWEFYDESYQTLIDNKIKEVLTIQN